MESHIFNRENFEVEEHKFLAPFAMKSSDSKGRDYPEEEHPFRSAFQRDRDRIVHTNAFRRLEYKTQVFVIHESDYYRTRLTHTMEVSQISRTLARSLRLNEDLTEAIALAHDLGHTPFGHSGEHMLNKLMEKFGGFEHNRQSLRIVEELEERYPEFSGLNLTWEVREGIDKHRSEYDKSTSGKFGTTFPTLEAQIVNLADEIAYSSHDQDDGIKSGLITIDQLKELSLCKTVLSKIRPHTLKTDELMRYQLTREIINTLTTDLIDQTIKNINKYNIGSVSDVKKAPMRLVDFSEEIGDQKKELLSFLLKNLYQHYKVKRMEVKSQKVIEDLFHIYLENFENIIPKAEQNKLKKYSKERIVCDIIAGMTDRFALEEHKRLFDPLTNV